MASQSRKAKEQDNYSYYLQGVDLQKVSDRLGDAGAILADHNKQFDLALKLLDDATALNPVNSLAWANKAQVLSMKHGDLQDLYRQYKLHEFGGYCRKAYSINPDSPRNCFLYGQYLKMIPGEQVHAQALLSQAIDKFDTGFAPSEFFEARAYVRQQLGLWLAAEDDFRNALKANPHSGTANIGLGMNLMTQGRMAESVDYYNVRLNPETHAFNDIESEVFDIKNHHEKFSITIVHEQGYGDMIMCGRYAKAFKDIGAEFVYLYCPDEQLAEIMRYVPDFDRVFTAEDEPSFSDYKVASMSCHAIFQYKEYEPYLKLSPSIKKMGRAITNRYAAKGQKLASVTWKGNPNHRNDMWRSMGDREADSIRGILRSKGYYDVSIQHDAATNLLPLEQLAYVSGVDLVVTVDTFISHVAGALGVPCITFISKFQDWRWGLPENENKWYANHRLIRQNKLGDWSEPINRLRDIL